jgi:ATP-dependent exoDNAse (exonuclease V) beta subunit
MASPLGAVLGGFGDGHVSRWHACRKRVLEAGMAGLLSELVAGLRERGALNPFLEQRLAGILRAALDYDESGGRELDEWVARLESLKQREYSAEGALQVMTVHKAKGLEFDMVVLPDLAGGAFDDPSKAGILEFKDAQGRIEGVLLAPGRKLLEADAALGRRFEAWSAEQCYERFCNLYVGLTRAKHASYVLLPKAPANPSSERRFDLWIRSVAGDAGGEVTWKGKSRVTLHEAGDAAWHDKVGGRGLAEGAEKVSITLGTAVARLERTTPSGAKKDSPGIVASPTGMAFGSALHAAFEAVGWVDEVLPVLPTDDAGRLVGELLGVSEIRSRFERGGRTVDLFREQAVEAILGGKWLSGIVDRLHVIRDGTGRVERVEVIDFKTDAVATAEQLVERHAGQMEAYREVMAKAFGGVPVRCLLLSTKLRGWVEVG